MRLLLRCYIVKEEEPRATVAVPGPAETIVLGACGGACPTLCRIAVSLLSHPNDSIAQHLGPSVLIGIGILSLLGAIVAYVWHETDRRKIFSVGIGLPALLMSGASGVNTPSQVASSARLWNSFGVSVYAQSTTVTQLARELIFYLPPELQGNLVLATFRTTTGGVTSKTVSTGAIVSVPQEAVSVTLSSINAESDPITIPTDVPLVRVRITAQKSTLYGFWFAIGVNTKPYKLNASIDNGQNIPTARLRLNGLEIRHDGSPFSTSWRFQLIVNDQEVKGVPEHIYGRKEKWRPLTDWPALPVPPTGVLAVRIKGYQDGKKHAEGHSEYIIGSSPGQQFTVDVSCDHKVMGNFIFHFVAGP